MQYRCVILSEHGEKYERVITAHDDIALGRMFNGSPSILLEYSEIKARKYRINNHLNNNLILQFTESMSALFSAGMSLQNSLNICMEITSNRNMTILCNELLQSIMNGRKFHDALTVFSPSFSPLYIAMVKLGETTNSLDMIFAKLALYLKRNREIKQKIGQALAYPVTVCITAILIAFFIIIFVLPRMQTIFEVFTSGTELTQVQQNFITLNSTVKYAGFFFLLSALLLIILIYMRSHSNTLQLAIDHIILRLPVLGNVIKTLYTSDFSFSMKILCSSGITFIEALEKSQEIIPNTAFQKALEKITDDISNGISIAKAFQIQNIFPGYVVSWIGIGERTGCVEKVFSQIHDYFNNESAQLIETITSAAQPFFIIVAGLVIILLLWWFVMPIFSLIGGL